MGGLVYWIGMIFALIGAQAIRHIYGWQSAVIASLVLFTALFVYLAFQYLKAHSKHLEAIDGHLEAMDGHLDAVTDRLEGMEEAYWFLIRQLEEANVIVFEDDSEDEDDETKFEGYRN